MNSDAHTHGQDGGKCPFHPAVRQEPPPAAPVPAPPAPKAKVQIPLEPPSVAEVLQTAGHDDHVGSLFDHPVASAYSCYSGITNPKLHPADKGPQAMRLHKIPRGQLWPEDGDDRVVPLAQTTHDMLRAHILGESFPCIGAKAAFSQGTYRFGFYKHLAHHSSVAAMGRDLRRFVAEYNQLGDFCTFVAAFKYPQSTTEPEFEQLLWQHLQLLHNADASSQWDPHYSVDPHSDHFAISYFGEAFFVVGFHSGASRFSRQFGRCLLVFNPESQIRRLKEAGELTHFATTVRQRDTKYQGGINPTLPKDVNSTGGEARGYSGESHPQETPWDAPFHPRPELLVSTDEAHT